MTPHSRKVVHEEDQKLFDRIRSAVENLPDGLRDHEGKELEISCHKLARAVGVAFKLKWQDGYFILPSYHHSWLRTDRGNIIDVYPIGMIGGPILVDAKNCYAYMSAYIALPTAMVSKKRFATVAFRKHVALIHQELKKQTAYLDE